MPESDGRSGAALPFTLLLLIAFTVLAAAGFLFAFLDLRTAENQASAVRAFYRAEAGLNRHRAESVDDTAGIVTNRYDIDGDTVVVTSSRLLKLDPLRELRLLRAEAAHDPLREGPSNRTVSQVAITPVPLRPPAALVSSRSINLGPRGRVSGIGATNAACTAAPTAVAGVVALPGGFQGDTASLRGRPPLLEAANIGPLLLASGLDWRNFERPEFVQPEITVTSNWPPSIAPAPGDWPVLYAEPTAPPIAGTVLGRGALVVAGDLVIPGSLRWEGLVLVAGSVTVSGILDVRGALYAGLAASGAGAGNPMDLGGAVTVVYDGCAAAEAAARLSRGIVSRPGGWFEVF
jgi:hypothetical protein